MRFLGVPLYLWGLLCLAIAMIFVFVAPRPLGDDAVARFLLLRWGHALVWLLLAFFCFARGANFHGLSNWFGIAAGLLYAAFILALVVK